MTVPSMASQCSLVIRAACNLCGLALIVAGTATAAFAGGPNPFFSAPEIDPGAAASALAALSGGVLLLTDRLRRKV